MSDFKLTHIGMKHEGGTKDYDILIIANQKTERAVMIRRWGKVGVAGQTMAMQFRHYKQADVYAQKIVTDKTRPSKGYVANTSTEALSYGEVRDLDYIGTSVSLSLKHMASADDMEFLVSDSPGLQPKPAPKSSTSTAHVTPAPAPEPAKPVQPAHYGSW